MSTFSFERQSTQVFATVKSNTNSTTTNNNHHDFSLETQQQQQQQQQQQMKIPTFVDHFGQQQQQQQQTALLSSSDPDSAATPGSSMATKEQPQPVIHHATTSRDIINNIFESIHHQQFKAVDEDDDDDDAVVETSEQNTSRSSLMTDDSGSVRGSGDGAMLSFGNSISSNSSQHANSDRDCDSDMVSDTSSRDSSHRRKSVGDIDGLTSSSSARDSSIEISLSRSISPEMSEIDRDIYFTRPDLEFQREAVFHARRRNHEGWVAKHKEEANNFSHNDNIVRASLIMSEAYRLEKQHIQHKMMYAKELVKEAEWRHKMKEATQQQDSETSSCCSSPQRNIPRNGSLFGPIQRQLTYKYRAMNLLRGHFEDAKLEDMVESLAHTYTHESDMVEDLRYQYGPEVANPDDVDAHLRLQCAGERYAGVQDKWRRIAHAVSDELRYQNGFQTVIRNLSIMRIFLEGSQAQVYGCDFTERSRRDAIHQQQLDRLPPGELFLSGPVHSTGLSNSVLNTPRPVSAAAAGRPSVAVSVFPTPPSPSLTPRRPSTGKHRNTVQTVPQFTYNEF